MKLGHKISRYTLINNLRACKNDNLYYSLYDDYEVLDIYQSSENKYMVEVLFIHKINSIYYQEITEISVDTLYIPIVHSEIIHQGKLRSLDFETVPHNEIYVFNSLTDLYVKSIYQYNARTLPTKVREFVDGR